MHNNEGKAKPNPYDDSHSVMSQKITLENGLAVDAEMWGESGYTFLTYRFPVSGLEHLTKEDIIHYLVSSGIQIDFTKFPIENMQLLKQDTLFNLTLTIGEDDE